MFRQLVLTLLLTAPLVSTGRAEDDHAHEHHVFEAGGIEYMHPWARAAAQGGGSLVFFKMHIEGAPDRLIGARTNLASEVHIVGLTVGPDGAAHQRVGVIDIPAGMFSFDPGGLALKLHGLTLPLEQGERFDLVLEFAAAGPVEIEVAVEANGAIQHSHAGHSH